MNVSIPRSAAWLIGSDLDPLSHSDQRVAIGPRGRCWRAAR
jgi:hypothetical protein